jgi:uncharacterized oligopeptide transporter (OPT) family protein
MTQGSELPILSNWQNFYMILGTAAATLTGRQVPHYQSTLEDWLWYMTFPFLANVLLILAAFVLQKNPSPALYIVGSAMMLLLLVGIRNAWDMVTFLAVERAHSENKSRSSDQAVRPVEK